MNEPALMTEGQIEAVLAAHDGARPWLAAALAVMAKDPDDLAERMQWDADMVPTMRETAERLAHVLAVRQTEDALIIAAMDRISEALGSRLKPV